MKPFISTKFYGVLNYILALTLIASPWLFHFYNVSSAALFLPIYFGWLQLILSIFSDNEAGIIKQLPLHTHLVIDVFMGFILLVSPWLWGFAYKEFLPQFLLGSLLFLLGLFTKKSPFTGPVHHTLPQGGEMTSAD
jgi:hypothetical protein